MTVGGRPRRECEVAAPISAVELLVDDLDDLLARGEALQHLLAERALAHVATKSLDDLEVDVGLEQREPDLAHRASRSARRRASALAEVAEDALEPVGKGVEHGRQC